MDKIADIASLVVIMGIVGVVVGSPNTRGQIAALLGGFGEVLRAASGQPRPKSQR